MYATYFYLINYRYCCSFCSLKAAFDRIILQDLFFNIAMRIRIFVVDFHVVTKKRAIVLVFIFVKLLILRT